MSEHILKFCRKFLERAHIIFRILAEMMDYRALIPVFHWKFLCCSCKIIGCSKTFPCRPHISLLTFVCIAQIHHNGLFRRAFNEFLSYKMGNLPYPAKTLLPEIIGNSIFRLPKKIQYALFKLLFFKGYFTDCYFKCISSQISQLNSFAIPFSLPHVNIPAPELPNPFIIWFPYRNSL